MRKAEPTDAEDIWKRYTAPQVVRNTLQLPYRSLESVRELLTKSGEGDHILVALESAFSQRRQARTPALPGFSEEL